MPSLQLPRLTPHSLERTRTQGMHAHQADSRPYRPRHTDTPKTKKNDTSWDPIPSFRVIHHHQTLRSFHIIGGGIVHKRRRYHRDITGGTSSSCYAHTNTHPPAPTPLPVPVRLHRGRSCRRGRYRKPPGQSPTQAALPNPRPIYKVGGAPSHCLRRPSRQTALL